VKKLLLILTLVLALFIQAAPVFAQSNDDDWEFSLKPYVWLLSTKGDLKYISLPSGSGGAPEVSMDANDLLENLDFGAIMASELRKGKWSLFSDFLYLKMSSSGSKVKAIDFGGSRITVTAALNLDAEVEIDAFTTTIVGGYEILNNEYLTMDLIGGVRYFWLEAELDWNLSGTVTGTGPLGLSRTFALTGQLTEDGELWNGVGGVRGKINLGESNWFIPYYADVGAGDSELTWQAFSGLGYLFEKWDVTIGYRHLAFENGDDSLVDNVAMSGPIIGGSYKF
jgi:opacity protein-like surface antigen